MTPQAGDAPDVEVGELERLRKIEELACDLAMVWQHWKISGLPRSHRNIMIDDLRKQLFALFPTLPAPPTSSRG